MRYNIDSVVANVYCYYMDLTNITAETAYTLGFIWADGSISKENKIKIAIKQVDAVIIEPTLMKAWNWNIRRNIQKTNPPGQLQMSFQKGSVELATKLISYNYRSKDQAPTILSIIPENLTHYWWRGYSDGDGCFCISRDGHCSYSICGPYTQDWSAFEKLVLPMEIHYRIGREINKKTGHKGSRIVIPSICGGYKFGNYIYQGFLEDRIGLTRKYEKYLQFNLPRNERRRPA